jgi:hypothetical protein
MTLSNVSAYRKESLLQKKRFNKSIADFLNIEREIKDRF